MRHAPSAHALAAPWSHVCAVIFCFKVPNIYDYFHFVVLCVDACRAVTLQEKWITASHEVRRPGTLPCQVLRFPITPDLQIWK